MKRLVRSASGRQIYGQKWQNSTGEGSQLTEIAKVSDTDAGNTIPLPVSMSPPHANATLPGRGQDAENQKQGHRKGNSSSCQSMYRAALVDDWVAAEMLLERDPALLCDEITERGERALHVAVAMNHKKFVQELIQRMSPNDLEELQDGKGYTACCYAAISGEVDIADILMKKNPNLGTARDQNNVTPLQKAALRSSENMIFQFLKLAKAEDLLEEEWFDLLLLAIRRKMYGVALGIFQKNGCSATMMNEEGTALHLLARQQILITLPWWGYKNLFGRMQPDLRRLAKALWAEIQRLGQDNVVELVNNPPILHDAARAGNVELITMLTRANPDLVWHTDSNGYTIFHIAVIHKQECVFSLIHQIGSMKDFIATTQDENGNNILHLAGKLTPLDRRNILPLVGLQMQREIVWFKKVEELAPPSCREMKNNDGLTPREVFSKEHKMLREESETWMRNVADSCLLVSTIMLTVVFAAAFTVPGGYNSETGLPVLMSNNWFICFIVSEVFALFGSIHSILQFWAIMTSSFEEDKFFYALPEILRMGLTGILWSLLGTVTAFFSAYFLVFYVGRARGALPFVLLIYVMLLVSIIMRFFSLWSVVLLQSKLSDVLSAANVIITPALSGTSERLVAQFPLKLLYGLSDANVRSTPAFSGTSERLVAQLPLKLLYVLSGSKRPKYTRLFRQ